MKILLLGSGGREHALAWKLTQSARCEKLFIAPGNAGTAIHGINCDFSVTDFEAIRLLCINEKIDLVVVGPEDPLVKGITDFLQSDPQLSELLVIGPSKEAAQLEGSKAFAKAFMQKHGIQTAAYKEFTLDNYDDGVEYLNQHAFPLVIKADGLAAGKGVVICNNIVEAMAEFDLMLHRAKFGEASKKVVVEEFLDGIEISVFVLTDGKSYIILPSAKDYKRVGEGDTGLNTGGMGAVSPVPFANQAFMKKVEDKIIRPTIEGLQKDNLRYCGFVFIGLMKVGDEPYVIEYNCRMGDPETEVVMPRLQNDLVDVLEAAARGNLNQLQVQTDPRTACTIVAVSGGYPGDYEKGIPIEGLEAVTGSLLFHSGTKEKDGKVVTNGGRVFCITSFGSTISEAAARSRASLEKIQYEGMYYRRDIGYEFF